MVVTSYIQGNSYENIWLESWDEDGFEILRSELIASVADQSRTLDDVPLGTDSQLWDFSPGHFQSSKLPKKEAPPRDSSSYLELDIVSTISSLKVRIQTP